MAITEVVVSIRCLCSVKVFLMANAKAIAPLKPKREDKITIYEILRITFQRSNSLN